MRIGPARGRKIRQRHLQSFWRAARRRRFGGERAFRLASTWKSGATAKRCGSKPTTRGKPKAKLKSTGKTRKTGTMKITPLHPDPTIFENHKYSYDILAQRSLRELAFLNGQGPENHAFGRRAQRQEHRVPFHRRHRRIRQAPEQGQAGARTILPSTWEGKKDTVEIEIALQYNDMATRKTFLRFANTINTVDGGTHLSGFRSGADAHDQQFPPRPQTC